MYAVYNVYVYWMFANKAFIWSVIVFFWTFALTRSYSVAKSVGHSVCQKL